MFYLLTSLLTFLTTAAAIVLLDTGVFDNGVQGGAPAANAFLAYLRPTEHFWSQLPTKPVFSLKIHSVDDWGTCSLTPSGYAPVQRTNARRWFAVEDDLVCSRT